MMALVIRLALNALALWIAAHLTNVIIPPGWGTIAGADDLMGVVLAALLLGAVNALIRPLVMLLTFLLQLLTLGLFTLVVNALMLMLTSWLAEMLGLTFRVQGFGAALVAAVLISLVSMVLTRVVR